MDKTEEQYVLYDNLSIELEELKSQCESLVLSIDMILHKVNSTRDELLGIIKENPKVEVKETITDDNRKM